MFSAELTIAGFDPQLAKAIAAERGRQEDHIEVIASENYASPRVLDHGGHLTHGAKVNFSGKLFKAFQYGINPDTGEIDYDQVDRLAREHRPKLIVAGFSAYSRAIDWARFRAIADSVGAYGRYGACRRSCGRRRLSEPRALRRCGDHHDAQDFAWTTRWLDFGASAR
jgi:glycine/serine hydroxymethyltransferase